MYNDYIPVKVFPVKKRYQLKIIHKQLPKKVRKIKVTNSFGAIAVRQLIPFKPVMKYQLEKRGFNVNNLQFRDVVSLYHNEFTGCEKIDSYEFRNHAAFKLYPNDDINGSFESFRNRMYFAKLNNVVNNIIDVFKIAKERNNYGENLTIEEKIQAKALNKIQNDLEQKMILSEPITKRNMKKFLIWAGIGILLYYVLKSL